MRHAFCSVFHTDHLILLQQFCKTPSFYRQGSYGTEKLVQLSGANQKFLDDLVVIIVFTSFLVLSLVDYAHRCDLEL